MNNKAQKLIAKLGKLNPQAAPRDITLCNVQLTHHKLPRLPMAYALFLQRCNGLEYNGVSLFGLNDDYLVKQNLAFHPHYTYCDEIGSILFIGRVDDDLFVYNAYTDRYEARDITGFDIWDSYATFDDFVNDELSRWLF